MTETEAYVQGHLTRDEFLAAKGGIAGQSMAELPSVDEAMNYADGYLEGIKEGSSADVADLITKVAALECDLSFEKAKNTVDRAELERLEPIAEVALRVDAAWADCYDAGAFDVLMDELYGVCSVYRTKQNDK